MSKLINPSELPAILRESKSRYTVIDNQTGQVYAFEGGIPSHKLKEVDAKLPGKNAHILDGKGLQEYFNSRSWVYAPSGIFKNWWNTMALKRARIVGDPMVDMFLEVYGKLTEEERQKDVTFYYIEEHHASYVEVTIKNFPIVAGFAAKSGNIRYYKVAGREVRL